MQSFPSVFISHGAPTFATEPGMAGANLGALGRAAWITVHGCRS
jgi:4,5-DOPA dioxygenase extradiol